METVKTERKTQVPEGMKPFFYHQPELLSLIDTQISLRTELCLADNPIPIAARIERLQAHEGPVVMVIGAGNVGISATEELTKKGYFVIVVDKDIVPGGLGSHNGGLSSLEKGPKKAEVYKKAMKVFEHENVLFFPGVELNVDQIDLLGVQGVIVATGAKKERRLSEINYDLPHVLSGSDLLTSINRSLDHARTLPNPDDLGRGKSIARGAHGSLLNMLFYGGGRVAVMDAPLDGSILAVRDEIIQRYGVAVANRIDYRKLPHGAGLVENVRAMGISHTALSKTRSVYRGNMELLRVKEPTDEIIARYRDGAASLDEREAERLASERARNDPEHQSAISRVASVWFRRQGISFIGNTTILGVTMAPFGRGVHVEWERQVMKGQRVRETVLFGAAVFPVGFEPDMGKLDIQTQYVKIGMMSGRGTLEESKDDAKDGVELLSKMIAGTPKDKTVLLEFAHRARQFIGEFDGNVVRHVLSVAPPALVEDQLRIPTKKNTHA